MLWLIIAKFACSIAGLLPKPNNINAMLPLAWAGMNKNIQGVQVVDKWKNMPVPQRNAIKDKMEDTKNNPLLSNPNFPMVSGFST